LPVAEEVFQQRDAPLVEQAIEIIQGAEFQLININVVEVNETVLVVQAHVLKVQGMHDLCLVYRSRWVILQLISVLQQERVLLENSFKIVNFRVITLLQNNLLKSGIKPIQEIEDLVKFWVFLVNKTCHLDLVLVNQRPIVLQKSIH
jgi:hypothetical protein